jgi:hypothetical protein
MIATHGRDDSTDKNGNDAMARWFISRGGIASVKVSAFARIDVHASVLWPAASGVVDVRVACGLAKPRGEDLLWFFRLAYSLLNNCSAADTSPVENLTSAL